jgi:hypothetical protein
MKNEYPNKNLAPWIPQSQRDSGQNLDEGFPEIETASAANEAMAVDEVFTPLGLKGRNEPIGTIFTEATTSHGPTPPLPLMTEQSANLAKRSAPRNAYKTNLEDK